MRLFAALGAFIFVERFVPLVNTYERWGLTPRETDVLALVASARSVPRMATELYVSENTVKAHMKSIYAKADAHSKQELLDAMARLG